jgi:hypothetical protein
MSENPSVPLKLDISPRRGEESNRYYWISFPPAGRNEKGVDTYI